MHPFHPLILTDYDIKLLLFSHHWRIGEREREGESPLLLKGAAPPLGGLPIGLLERRLAGTGAALFGEILRPLRGVI